MPRSFEHQRLDRTQISPKAKYQTPEQMEEKLKAYFAQMKAENRPFTITGIADALELERVQLITYQNKPEFYPLISKAKRQVEIQCEERLYLGTNCTGTIFSMKNNFGWRDQQHVEVDARNTNITIVKHIDARSEEYTQSMLDVTNQIKELSVIVPTKELEQAGLIEKKPKSQVKKKKK